MAQNLMNNFASLSKPGRFFKTKNGVTSVTPSPEHFENYIVMYSRKLCSTA